MSDELLELAGAQVPPEWHRDVLSLRERLIRDLAARVRELEAERDALRALADSNGNAGPIIERLVRENERLTAALNERTAYACEMATLAGKRLREIERLRALLREAADAEEGQFVFGYDLRGRVDAALSGEKP